MLNQGFLFDAATKDKGGIVYRPYQKTAINNAFEQWQSHQSTLIAAATGTGKSVIFSGIMEQFPGPGRCLVLAHRNELITQASNHAYNAGLTVGIEMASQFARNEDVVVSTIQTQSAASRCPACMNNPRFSAECSVCDGVGKVRRFTKFNPMDFKLLIIDEFHHAISNSYRAAIQWYLQNPQLKMLGVTATPKRTDKVGLHNVCQSIAFEYDIIEAINDGWLVPIRQRFVEVHGLDLSKVATTAGDLNDSQVEAAFLPMDVMDERILHEVARPTLDEAQGKPVIVFAPGQEYARRISAAFNSYSGVRSEYVIDSTSKELRKDIIERYKSGVTQVLVNCMVFTEGFDAPETAVVANVRPTKSELVYRQMIGRGTRTLPGVVDGIATVGERLFAIASSSKPLMTILDFVGNSGRHKLVSSFDILAGKNINPLDLEAAKKLARESGAAVDVDDLVKIAKQKRDDREAKNARAKERRKNMRQDKTKHFASHADYTATDIDLFAGAKTTSNLTLPPTVGGATEKQVAYLIRNLKIPQDKAVLYSKAQAGKAIGRHLADLKRRGPSKAPVKPMIGKYRHSGDQRTIHDMIRDYNDKQQNLVFEQEFGE